MSAALDTLCDNGQRFWDVNASWNAPEPVFSRCFDNIALTLLPCSILWLFFIVEVIILLKQNSCSIHNSAWNIAKMFLCFILCILSVILFGNDIYKEVVLLIPIDLDSATYCIMSLTYALSFILMYMEKKKGMYSSWLQTTFWFVLACTEGIKYRNLYMDMTTLQSLKTAITVERFIGYFIFPLVFSEFILICISESIPSELLSDKKAKPSPFIVASILSKLNFSWFDKLVWKGFRKHLTIDDLWDITTDQKASVTKIRFNKKFKTDAQKKEKMKLPFVLMSMYKWELIASVIPALIAEILRYLCIIIQRCIVDFVTKKDQLWNGILYAILMILLNFLQGLLTVYTSYETDLIITKMNSAMISATYKKSLRLSSESRQLTEVGEIINIVSVDTQRLHDLGFIMSTVYGLPIAFIACVLIMWNTIGVASLTPIIIWILSMCIFMYLSSLQKTSQAKQLAAKDERIKFMDEILNGIKVLKLYAWELCLFNHVKDIRKREVDKLKSAQWWSIYNTTVYSAIRFILPIATFGTLYIINPYHSLDANTAFTVVSTHNAFRYSLIFIPTFTALIIQVYIGLQRIEKFLSCEELEDCKSTCDVANAPPVMLKDASFSWTKENKLILQKMNLSVSKGELVTVVGPVGSGKSSLLLAILGEMYKRDGNISTEGMFGYVPQQAWLMNSTVRNNILFGKPYDEKYYQSVVEACALKSDFKIFPNGDATEIGERGVALSGGQKLRITLARAVYSRSDVYLLDDPLSAVDPFVAKHIFTHVIGPNGLLKNNTRILVTHNVTCLPKSDMILVLNEGRMVEIGTYKELLFKGGEFTDFLLQYGQEEKEAHISDNAIVSLSTILEEGTDDAMEPLENDEGIQHGTSAVEKMEKGSIRLSSYLYYFKSATAKYNLITILCYLLTMAFATLSEFWLSAWTSDPPLDDLQAIIRRRNYRMGVYGVFGIVFTLANTMSNYGIVYGTHAASTTIHNRMLHHVLRLPTSFFDVTPKGQILNRLSKDMDQLDVSLPLYLTILVKTFADYATPIINVCIAVPWFLGAYVPACFLYFVTQHFAMTLFVKLTRLQSVTRSPIYSFVSETIAGCELIRAFRKEEDFIQTYDDHIDTNRRCFIPYTAVRRWIEVRFLFISSVLVGIACLLCVFERYQLSASIVALIVTNALAITKPLAPMAKAIGQVQSQIVSVERIKEYSKLSPEDEWDRPEMSKKQTWPSAGEIQFHNYTTGYRPELPATLHSINCVIKGGEKVGVVGRTGAGKSSLTMALFRIVEPREGSVLIDGIDLSLLGLHNLRSCLTIIPQDPVLFSGSLRFNLDPFQHHVDEELINALQYAHMKEFVDGLKDGLDYEISEGGSNLSVGQKQLICLARAILRNTKIIILDEATASIDAETDDLVQKTIREKFGKCTVLTIAHRLSTIMDSDRIMVLSDGEIIEFDTPANLLIDENSTFHQMAKDAGLIDSNIITYTRL